MQHNPEVPPCAGKKSLDRNLKSSSNEPPIKCTGRIPSGRFPEGASHFKHISQILIAIPVLSGCAAIEELTCHAQSHYQHFNKPVRSPDLSPYLSNSCRVASLTFNCPAISAQTVNFARPKNGPCAAGTNPKCTKKIASSP